MSELSGHTAKSVFHLSNVSSLRESSSSVLFSLPFRTRRGSTERMCMCLLSQKCWKTGKIPLTLVSCPQIAFRMLPATGPCHATGHDPDLETSLMKEAIEEYVYWNKHVHFDEK